MATTGPETSSIALRAGLFGRQAVVDVVLNRLDHDDGIVDDQSDRQHEAEQRQRIDGKPKQRKERECADQRDRHSQERNERRAPALEEDIDDNDHEDQRLEERVDDLLDAFPHGLSRIERGDIVEIGREALAFISSISLVAASIV